MESSPDAQLKPLDDQEAQDRQSRKKGGWITLPFIAGAYKIRFLAHSDLSVHVMNEIVSDPSVA